MMRTLHNLMLILGVAGLCLLHSVAASETKGILQDGQRAVKRVAVIGAGSGGTSAAYHINKFAHDADIDTHITILERNDYIGGRSTTVNAWDEEGIPIELGGSIFVQVNKVLMSVAEEFNLTGSSLRRRRATSTAPALGVWDGETFVFQTSAGSWWLDLAKLVWRYGWAPIKTNNLMKSVVGKFLKMYDEPVFPFDDLSRVSSELGLTAITAATGEQFLEENGISRKFANEIVQASTRVNYAQNLGLIHGLETMVCMATDGAIAIEGGNWQMFSHMAHASTEGKNIHLNTTVTSVSSSDEDDTYQVCWTGIRENCETFDTVVLASPYQFANLTINPSAHQPDKIPYVQLHVTLFASPHTLWPGAFNLSPNDQVPETVLTTLPPDQHPHASPDGVGRAGFFSISQLVSLAHPQTGRPEFIYKIFSPTPVNSTYLAHLLGVPGPKDSAAEVSENDVSWIHRKIWDSYPYEYPRVTFERIKLAENLWYTSGIESFISTMETSALSGKNVARLVVNEWVSGHQAKVAKSGEVELSGGDGPVPTRVEL